VHERLVSPTQEVLGARASGAPEQLRCPPHSARYIGFVDGSLSIARRRGKVVVSGGYRWRARCGTEEAGGVEFRREGAELGRGRQERCDGGEAPPTALAACTRVGRYLTDPVPCPRSSRLTMRRGLNPRDDPPCVQLIHHAFATLFLHPPWLGTAYPHTLCHAAVLPTCSGEMAFEHSLITLHNKLKQQDCNISGLYSRLRGPTHHSLGLNQLTCYSRRTTANG